MQMQQLPTGGNNRKRGILLLYSLPIIVHLIFLLFWFSPIKGVTLVLTETILGTFITPIYLIIISSKFIGVIKIRKFLGYLILMVLIIGLIQLIQYFNWGVSTGNLLSPDSETMHIVKWEILIASIITVIGWTIVCIIKNNLT